MKRSESAIFGSAQDSETITVLLQRVKNESSFVNEIHCKRALLAPPIHSFGFPGGEILQILRKHCGERASDTPTTLFRAQLGCGGALVFPLADDMHTV